MCSAGAAIWVLTLLGSSSGVRANGPAVIQIGPESKRGHVSATPQAARDALARGGFTLADQTAFAASFSLPDAQGRMQSLESFRGRWLLLNFFATWCGPCAQEMPSLQGLAKTARGRLSVVGVATASPDVVAEYGRSKRLTFPLLYDADNSVGGAYGVDRFPTTFIIDPQGIVVAYLVGGTNWRRLLPFVARFAH